MNGPLGAPRSSALLLHRWPHASRVGLLWALALFIAWSASLVVSLTLPLQSGGLPGAVPVALILLRTLLQTGLFIVGHDAMHGSLLPCSPRWNARIGRLALGLYACLPWESCRRNHRLHHQAPASPGDPDHHGAHRLGPLRWYLRFMASYLTPPQMLALLGGWLVALVSLEPFTAHPLQALLLFWSLPLLLSSLQLFVFGTYLPHRLYPGRSEDRHLAASLAWPEALSFLACFHFGYHWEHHRHPQLPWFRLHSARRSITEPDAQGCPLALPEASR